MSTIAEMAKAEADATEAELGDDDPDDNEPEEDPEPEQIPDEPEAAGPVFDEKALEKELRRHAGAMAKALGDGWAGMEPCEHCGTMGYTPVGFEPPPVLQTDPDTVRCAQCSGLGVRLSTSLAPGYETVPCTRCVGKGYVERQIIEAEEAQARYAAQAAAQAPPPVPVYNPQTGAYELPGSASAAPPAPQWNATAQRYEWPDGSEYVFPTNVVA